MNEYKMIVPLNYNNGTEVDYSQFQLLEGMFIDLFGGYTNGGIVEGAWQGDDGKIYRDRSRVYYFACNYEDQAEDVAGYVRDRWKQECVYLALVSTNVRFI
jgi:hypothetical protein